MGRIARLQSTVLRENVLSLVDSRIYTGSYDTTFLNVNLGKPSLTREIVIVLSTGNQLIDNTITINGQSMLPYLTRIQNPGLAVAKIYYPEGETADIYINVDTAIGMNLAVYRSSYRLNVLDKLAARDFIDISKPDGITCLCAANSTSSAENIFTGFITEDISANIPVRNMYLKTGRFIEGESANISGRVVAYVAFSIY